MNFSMSELSNPKQDKDALPKSGRVNEVCREWLVREDGALAYRLQNEEIDQHLTGNKSRNAQVREDFPCALTEQMREEQQAEIAAALYQQMVREQDERDAKVAAQIAARIEKEESERRRAIEERDKNIARRLLEQDRLKQLQRLQDESAITHQNHAIKPNGYPNSPQNGNHHFNNNTSPIKYREPPLPNLTKRQGQQLPLPNETRSPSGAQQVPGNSNSPTPPTYQNVPSTRLKRLHNTYENVVNNSGKLSPCNLVDPINNLNLSDHIGVPFDEVEEKRLQEAKDAELARQLQEEEEDAIEMAQLAKDRLLAIEAQDKELARLLQERERAKARRAKERAKQRSLAKKQLQQQQELEQTQISDSSQLVEQEDSYSDPVDLITPTEQPHRQLPTNGLPKYAHNYNLDTIEDDVNYSYPIDNVTQEKSPTKQTPTKSYQSEIRMSGVSPLRPNHLDLRNSASRPSKPRYSQPQELELEENANALANLQITPTNMSPHLNIAMAIDPTYSRRMHGTSPPEITNAASSPVISLPPPDLSDDDTSPVPPYMPIQGQRRTASLEKKIKKSRAKDGCKQQ